MIEKTLHKLFLYLIFSTTLFAGTLGKSHSAELLSRGRSVPMAMSDNVLVTAKTFSSLSSRILDVYIINESDGDFVKSGEIRSPNPMAGDDFGFSIALTSNFMLVGAPGFNNGHGAAFLYKKIINSGSLIKFLKIQSKQPMMGFLISLVIVLL